MNVRTLARWQEDNPLRLWRIAEDLAVGDVAAALGASRSALRAWEAGEYRPAAAHMAVLRRLTGLSDLSERWEAWWRANPYRGDRAS